MENKHRMPPDSKLVRHDSLTIEIMTIHRPEILSTNLLLATDSLTYGEKL